MEKRWINPYIPLVSSTEASSSGLLNEEAEGGFSPKDREILLDKIKKYPDSRLEIGSGSGMHLLDLAERNPSSLCIGVELRYKRAYRTLEKAAKRELDNIIIVRGNIHTLLSEFPDRSISNLYIHFPDPWSKKRWKKHQLIKTEFLDKLLIKAVEGCKFSFRTDNQEYFKGGYQTLSNHPKLYTAWSTEDFFSSPYGKEQKPSSEFESLFYHQNKPIGACLMKYREG